MGRPHIEFIQASDVALTALGWGPFEGIQARILSEDEETLAFTALATLPAGRHIDLNGGARPIELFGLSGEGTLAGQPFGEGSYAYVPSGAANADLDSTSDSLLLLMVEDERNDGGGEVNVIDTNGQRLADHGVEGVPPGLVIKLLRVDQERGDWTWIAACSPGWQEDRAEIHPTVEEALMLRGDILLGERGEMSAGSYFWRPPMVRHGPMYSRGGNLIFFRTKGGGMAVTWESVPGWQEMVDAYRAKEPLYLGP
jgi:Domain of unknown function (DUF4437)